MGGLNLQNRTSQNPGKRSLAPVDMTDFVAEAMGMMM
jgi:hypothetical protein